MNFTQTEKEKVILRARTIIMDYPYKHKNLYLDILNHHEETGLFYDVATPNWYVKLGFSEKYKIDLGSKRYRLIFNLRKIILQAVQDLKKEETSVNAPLSDETIFYHNPPMIVGKRPQSQS